MNARRPIAEVVESNGVRLRGSGRVRQGFCPFHEDRSSPSLTVYSDSQRFHRFGCGSSGDALDFMGTRDY